MKRTFFDKYSEFKCIANECPATCCSGWIIEIDEESLDMYAALAEKNRDFWHNKIDFDDHSFKQQSNGDCAFLLSDGFCQLQRQLGEECLCTTCDMYPRHVEEFPGVREYSLSLSCPAVAKRFLEETDGLEYETVEDSIRCQDASGEISYDDRDAGNQETAYDDQVYDDEAYDDEEYDDFNAQLYEVLKVCREEIFIILKDRSCSFKDRALLVLNYIKIIQEQLDIGDYDTHLKPKDCPKVYNETLLDESEEMFDIFLKLEPLNEEFVAWIKEAGEVLKISNALDTKIEVKDINDFDAEIMLERISLYFIFTYFCGAVYDNYVFALAREAIYNSYMIMYLMKAKIIMQGGISADDAAEIVYRYSRELEHSNENLILLEQLLDVGAGI